MWPTAPALPTASPAPSITITPSVTTSATHIPTSQSISAAIRSNNGSHPGLILPAPQTAPATAPAPRSRPAAIQVAVASVEGVSGEGEGTKVTVQKKGRRKGKAVVASTDMAPRRSSRNGFAIPGVMNARESAGARQARRRGNARAYCAKRGKARACLQKQRCHAEPKRYRVVNLVDSGWMLLNGWHYRALKRGKARAHIYITKRGNGVRMARVARESCASYRDSCG
ncbi:hypothetical protein EV424DRAFT_1341548 [Suillus variegatus]|nr:hypothetical protein EV424DRAFT_1341548 [Suillus variegatus]